MESNFQQPGRDNPPHTGFRNTKSHVNLTKPPQCHVHPQEIAGPNSRPYEGKPMGFHSPLIGPAISWG